jgi:hypothetical protein
MDDIYKVVLIVVEFSICVGLAIIIGFESLR